ncbi:MAG: neutral zinc metallopeptidase [Anaerolineae bacterium]|nr:neutral zinc metallopeptidase [Anaerolineae bacterium]
MSNLINRRHQLLVALLLVVSIIGMGTTVKRVVAQDDPVTELVTTSEEDLNAFWSQTFTDEKLGDYKPPSAVTAYEGETPMDTPCGETEAENAFFCPEDKAIYYDTTWFAQEYDKSQNNGYSVVGIIAHEWGHYIQDLLDQKLQLSEGHYSIEIELQADCLAGNFTRYLYDGNGSLEITADDLKEGMNSFFDIGDDENTKWDDPDAHGSSAQRSQAFLMGYNQSVAVCLDTSRIAEIANVEGEPAATEAVPAN